jgi:hypothetical protein
MNWIDKQFRYECAYCKRTSQVWTDVPFLSDEGWTICEKCYINNKKGKRHATKQNKKIEQLTYSPQSLK